MTLPSSDKQEGMTDNATTSSDFKQLLSTEVRISPDPDLVATLAVKDYQALYNKAQNDLAVFWDEIARDFTWFKPWTQVVEGDAPNARWFTGAQLNITTNCLDHQV